ncbi:MAG: cytochrome b/b6 domain-containing protein [Campylobacterales bacterium]|nr:cytochrome b/b6 domain-containing protein [Campylobacterales bacterium]
MNIKKGLVFVWPLSTRIIHWIIAVSFMGAFYTSFYEPYLDIHVALGWIFGVMLGYRILWGFVGPRYATFNTFKLSFDELVWYFREKIIDRWRKIPPGHNPASSWYTILVLSLGSIIVTSGLLLYGIQEGKGLFAFLNDRYYMYMSEFDLIHRYISYLLGVWALIHITGVLIEQFYHKTNMLFAMITGYKKSEGPDTDISMYGRIASYLFIILSVIAFYYIVSTYDNLITRSKFPPVSLEEVHRVYATDCGTCHKPYPAYLFPQKSWERLMNDLHEHFNERITEQNISIPARASIQQYLFEHSAEHSTREAAVKMLASIGDAAPISSSKVLYWRETHAQIDPSVYKRPSIKSRANCAACHIDFEFGVLDDTKIVIPKE